MVESVFRIEFVDGEDFRDAGYLWLPGRIVIGDSEERLRMLIFDWERRDYERQWRRALISITRGATYACLVTVMPPVGAREMAELWPLLREGDDVRMRNISIPPEEINRDAPSAALSEDDFTDEGAAEWRFSVDAVRRFLRETSR